MSERSDTFGHSRASRSNSCVKGVMHLAILVLRARIHECTRALRARRLELYIPVRVNFGSILHSYIVYDLIVVIVIEVVGFNDVQSRIARGRRL